MGMIGRHDNGVAFGELVVFAVNCDAAFAIEGYDEGIAL